MKIYKVHKQTDGPLRRHQHLAEAWLRRSIPLLVLGGEVPDRYPRSMHMYLPSCSTPLKPWYHSGKCRHVTPAEFCESQAAERFIKATQV